MVRHMCPPPLTPTLLHTNPIHARSVSQLCVFSPLAEISVLEEMMPEHDPVQQMCVHMMGWVCRYRKSRFLWAAPSLDHWMYLGWGKCFLGVLREWVGVVGCMWSSLWVAPGGRASVIVAISFCCRGNCFILLAHSGRHPNRPEQMMSHSTQPRAAASWQPLRFVRPLFLWSKLNVKNTTEAYQSCREVHHQQRSIHVEPLIQK